MKTLINKLERTWEELENLLGEDWSGCLEELGE